jgi:hypothetical protein
VSQEGENRARRINSRWAFRAAHACTSKSELACARRREVAEHAAVCLADGWAALDGGAACRRRPRVELSLGDLRRPAMKQV